MNKRWTYKEDALLCEHWPRLCHDEALCREVLPDRTTNAIRCRANAIGLTGRRDAKWSADELLSLIDQYPRHGFEWEGWRRLLPGRSKNAVREKASSLGIRHGYKIPRRLDEMDSRVLLKLVRAIADAFGLNPRDVADELCRLAYVHEIGGDDAQGE